MTSAILYGGKTIKTVVYIDGFNFYYLAVKGTPYKWLDFGKMCRLLLPEHRIVKLKYFTAQISARPSDPDQATRQQTFFRALRTIPNLEIILGHFLTNEVFMPKAGCPPNAQRFVKVIKTEEKGSDVNIATHLLSDGYRGEYETAVLISNDSDLLEPIRMVRRELGLPVGLILPIVNPMGHPSKMLMKEASFIKKVRKGLLAASQFPSTMADAIGKFSKPSSW